jgi:hypothetical protein
MLTSHRVLALAFTIAACASNATITSTWKSPSAPPLTNVVTLSPVSDPGLRRQAEDSLAQQLTSEGVRAVPGYTVLRDQDLASHEGIINQLRGRGYDGVVTMRLVAANQQLQVYPNFNGYWGAAWGGMNVVPETVVRIEVNAYSLASQQLVFSAMSKDVDPGSAQQAISDVSKVTGAKLAQEHVIASTQAAMK